MPAQPGSVALYLTSLAVAEKKVATSERALVAISQAHKLHGFPSPRKAPEVTEVLQGIRRTLGVAPNQKDPVLVDTLRALVESMRRDDPGDVRDRAVICLGFASGCRRSELATAAAKAGTSERSIMKQTGHPARSLSSAAIIRDAELFDDNAAAARVQLHRDCAFAWPRDAVPQAVGASRPPAGVISGPEAGAVVPGLEEFESSAGVLRDEANTAGTATRYPSELLR